MEITGLERDLTVRCVEKTEKSVFAWVGKKGMVCGNCGKTFEPTFEQVEKALKGKTGLAQFDCPGCAKEMLSFHITRKEYPWWKGKFSKIETLLPINFLNR